MRETKTSKLNNEQRKLVEENYNLLYGFMTNHNLDYNQWYDICAIGLCKAALRYNTSANFSTYAYKCMLNEVRNEMQKLKLKKNMGVSETVSLSTEVHLATDKIVCTLDEFIASKRETEKEAVGRIWAEWFIDKLPLTTLKILLGKLQAKTLRDISEEVGVSFSRCSAAMRDLREYYKRNSRYVLLSNRNEAERKIYKEKILKKLDKLS